MNRVLELSADLKKKLDEAHTKFKDLAHVREHQEIFEALTGTADAYELDAHELDIEPHLIRASTRRPAVVRAEPSDKSLVE